MYDVNNHPKQAQLNSKIASVLSVTVRSLNKISSDYEVDARDLVNQFRTCFDLMVEQELEFSDKR